MKLRVVVHDLTTIHEFEHKYVTMWTNQNDKLYSFKPRKNFMNDEFSITKPLCLIFGVYGIRTLDGEKITHPCGNVVIDVSKLKVDQETSIITNITDTTTQLEKTGTLRLSITTNGTPPCSQALNAKTSLICHGAAENNLSQISPFAEEGYPPIISRLLRLHSPYYTSNIGIQMPAGAFLINCGSGNQNHMNKLQTAIHVAGWTDQEFIDAETRLCAGSDETKICLNIVAKTLTMHTIQCLKYVPDIQFSGASKIPTDRWECPRYEHNFVGDCEDCSKEIFVEIHEWNTMITQDTLARTMQKILDHYIPLVVQGAVEINGQLKNHIWASLMSKYDFRQRLSAIDIGMEPFPLQLPLMLLEGTAAVYPFELSQVQSSQIEGTIKRIKKMAPLFKHILHEDVSPGTFYKYVVACMTPQFKTLGYLDFNCVANGKYGVTFQNWLDNKYTMTPACKHSKNTIQLIEHVVGYDKPITPLTYKTIIIDSSGKKTFPSGTNIVFGYKLLSRNKHYKILDSIKKLRRKGWEISMTIIDHGICRWVDITFTNVITSNNSLILL